jgi:nucleoside-diphosphate-sugar epimerase
MAHIAVTGGTGFIGSHILDVLEEQGCEVRALTRQPASAPRPGLTWIPGDLSDEAALRRLIQGARAVIHGAGAVKARNAQEFMECNATAVARVAKIVAEEAPDARLVHLSSLVAREPGLSPYAASKAAGEAALLDTPSLDWVILRPPAVYGPRDREMLRIFKALKSNMALMPGPGSNRLSLIHGRDAAEAAVTVALGAKFDIAARTFDIDDGNSAGYAMAEVYQLAAKLLDRNLNPRTIPRPLLTIAAQINTAMAPLMRQAPMLTPGKVAELTHPDWVARGPMLQNVTTWRPKVDLARGLAETFAWYRQQGLL